MIHMKYLKNIKSYSIDIIFIALIGMFFFIYMFVYMTESRRQMYQYNINQIKIIIHELTKIGR